MCTDGTVTRSLQAYFDEAIDVRVLRQSVQKLATYDQWLSCERGEEVVRRQVMLVGGTSRTVYAYADTVLNSQRLPASVQKDLAEEIIGLGELMQLRGLETYREIHDTGKRMGLPEEFTQEAVSSVGECAWRHYSIRHGQQVVMHIKEFFPIVVYAP